MNGCKDPALTEYQEDLIERLKGVERAITNGLGSGQAAPAIIESIAMALGVTSHGTGSFAQDVSKIADALERIAEAVERPR